jgi:hypothetical protein
MTTPASINTDLAIATIVKRIEFTSDERTGRCSLVLELLNDDRRSTARVVVEAHGVTEWRTLGLGGGVTQLLCLRASDVSDQQHDRVRFVLEDLENGALSLKCEELATTRISVDG